MATHREIRRRIVSVRNTQQITRAMKMVAAAKLRKAQTNLLNARPYALELSRVLGHLATRHRAEHHPLLEVRRPRRVGYVLVTADRGLCGSFNTNLIRRATAEFDKNGGAPDLLIAVGRKGYDHFRRLDAPVTDSFADFFNHLEFIDARRISDRLIKLYRERRVDRLLIIYNEFKSAVQQEIRVEQLLPIRPLRQEDPKPIRYIFDPNAHRVLSQLVPMHLNFQIWRILLESSASEHGARMTAMETATDNAQEMIRGLVLNYNKARQAAITNELNEIVSGSEALRG